MIKNGNEQYSYSNLSAVKVSKGDEVKVGTELGVNAISSFSETKNDFLLKFLLSFQCASNVPVYLTRTLIKKFKYLTQLYHTYR